MKRLFTSLLILLVSVSPAYAQDVDDGAIAGKVSSALEKDKALDGAVIHVTSVHGYVLLTGQATSPDQKQQASIAVAFATNDMRRLVNEIEVVDAVDESFSDSDAELLDAINKRIEYLARSTHPVVYNGVVHLMGQVTHDEADAAASAISRMPGVKTIRLSYEFTE